ncbi:hydroxymethylglutaryl-CoA reductase (NADPH) [Saprolegnia diclina VS20]|uniref:3-hydroxy-3-methylglutaryl coenzyme A reductase n=1 Tax=Saprolegnia diclina (strain VS20) TaxID=1156394 RepID=T0RFL5_SAPDV|nr:hydroxymethylglutaryl-CoA reductase (NADPH) [Saprolegnia diclina VS20]EQC31078.1 hydroxymethylglutaryl-CoA reductase (NADPH) [Saprolegnia diclina VS20]|eukprot:XP_008615517.1 hydroxymethylglutaryl-CoA reductase (NADPH) [Saprolegnia diclina VS20]
MCDLACVTIVWLRPLRPTCEEGAMLVLLTAAVLISTESVRSALETTFAWGVALLVDHTQEFFWGLLLLTCFSLLSYIMEPEKPKGPKASQPRWELFRLSNYFVIAVFVVSLATLLSHENRLDHRAPKPNPLVLYAAAAACMLSLTYFFAFFAVGFVSNQVADSDDEDKWPAKAPRKCQPELAPVAQLAADDAAVLDLLMTKDPVTGRPRMALHELEKKLGDMERAVHLRREYFKAQSALDFSNLPVQGYDYAKIYGSNCEVVVGYVPLPVGLAGPIQVNGENVYLPMATTEGCLIASTNRGCKVLSMGSGVQSVVLADGITRAPCVRFPRARDAAALKAYLDDAANWTDVAAAFNSTTRYGRLTSIKTIQSGRNCYVRIVCNAGNAMGMNMVSKGTLAVLGHLQERFPDMELVAISGNVCTDKKSAAINWIDGRGKSVVADAVVKADVVARVLHTTVDKLVDLNLQKNLVGSAMAGALGGFNAHAANILTAIFLATGQDPAQNVESSSCMTMLEKTKDGDLYISVTMPSIEVGTVGGGTHLGPQQACLGLMGCAPHQANDDATSEQGARRLACAIAAGVMAGELSLLAAISTNELVKSHMELNRKK